VLTDEDVVLCSAFFAAMGDKFCYHKRTVRWILFCNVEAHQKGEVADNDRMKHIKR
jgi:hypothetical protein